MQPHSYTNNDNTHTHIYTHTQPKTNIYQIHIIRREYPQINLAICKLNLYQVENQELEYFFITHEN